MLKKLSGVVLSGALMMAAPFANSATVDEVAGALADARANTLQLINSTDKVAQESLKAKIGEASTKLDTTLTTLLADKTTAADKIEQLKAFKTNWEDFKKTRETEIIPAILSGKADVAKGLAKGIQAERMQKMKAALVALGWKDPEAK